MRIVMVASSFGIDSFTLEDANDLCNQDYELIFLAVWQKDLPLHERNRCVKLERINAGELLTLRRAQMASLNIRSKTQKWGPKTVAGTVIACLFNLIDWFLRLFINLYPFLFSQQILYFKLRERLVYFDPDIIHVFGINVLKPALQASRQLNIPLIFSSRSAKDVILAWNQLSFSQRNLVRKAERVIGFSNNSPADLPLGILDVYAELASQPLRGNL